MPYLCIARLFLLAASATHALALPNAEFKRSDPPPCATVDIGVLYGTTTSLPSATAVVNKFLGVPFASPPTRFSPPTSPKQLSAPLTVQAWKPSCIQQFAGPAVVQGYIKGIFEPYTPVESEDCLYLNVYAPSTPAPQGGRAVMFWLYGGAFQFGTAGQPTYDGSAFAAYQDVIVVTSNYRMNVFGFPNSPQISTSQQNVGLLDQHMALQWVQTNIHAFGGNPKLVTVFGQSAGAVAVDALLTAPDYTAQGATAPFAAAILQSGQNTYQSLGKTTNSTAAWQNLAKALNCTTPSNYLACVKAAPATTIQSIINSDTSYAFGPVPDGHTLATSPAQARAAGQFVKVPVLEGSNLDDGTAFVFSSNNYTTYLQSTFGSTAPSSIPQVEKTFPVGNASDSTSNANVIGQVETALGFLCTASLWGNETVSKGVSVWRYLFDVTYPNYSPLNGALGVWHSSEVPLVFQTYAGGPINPVTANPEGYLPTNVAPVQYEINLSKWMNAAWANFAKNPSAGPGWVKLATTQGNDMAAIGAYGYAGASTIDRRLLDAPCQALLPQIRAATGPAPGLP